MAGIDLKVPIQVNLPDDWIEQIVNRLRNDPEAEWVEIVRCKDCKYFELDHFEKVEAFPVPIIVAHEICMKWSA